MRVYALDLLGSGWSDKPARDDPAARAVNGENGRFIKGPEGEFLSFVLFYGRYVLVMCRD